MRRGRCPVASVLNLSGIMDGRFMGLRRPIDVTALTAAGGAHREFVARVGGRKAAWKGVPLYPTFVSESVDLK